jgi:DNA-directed RNA polymerase specialized sigma24 family protein
LVYQKQQFGKTNMAKRPKKDKEARMVPTLEALQSSPEDLRQLWRDYCRRPTRDRRDLLTLVYMPWVVETLTAVAGRMRFRDREDAIGEGLLHFIKQIIPSYNGSGRFERFAKGCLVHCLISVQRRQSQDRSMPVPSTDNCWCESQPDSRRAVEGVDFRKLVRWLPRRQAAIVRLAYGRRNLSAVEIAAELELHVRVVKAELHAARRAIRIHWGGRIDELLK